MNRPRRGNTKQAKYESYRLDAINYVNDRDAKIVEITADIMRKYPRIDEAEARRLVVEHFAALERANDTRNAVRSLDLGFDERAFLERVNARLNRRPQLQIPDRLSEILRGPSDRPDAAEASIADPLSSEAVAAIYDASRDLAAVMGGGDVDARYHIYNVIRSNGGKL
jgi:hypothetical protein